MFRAETLGTIRRRVGRLSYPKHFISGLALAAAANTVTLEATKARATSSLIGLRAFVVDGLGAGQESLITANTVGSGVVTVAPAWTTQPDVTSRIEIWPDGQSPEAVNAAINQAVLQAHAFTSVPVDYDQTGLTADRLSIPLNAALVAITDICYQEAGGLWRKLSYIPDPAWWGEYDYAFKVVDGVAYFRREIPTDILAFKIRGYRVPAEMTTESQVCEVHPGYLALQAAYYLEAGDASGPGLDPEQHAGRAGNWLGAARELRAGLQTRWLPGTRPL